MGDKSQTKTCPLCAESIKAAAKACPFCQHRQGRFAFWRTQMPVLVSVICLAGMAALGCYLLLSEIPATGRSFVGHRNELRVLRTSLERDKKKPEFWFTGFVTNTGRYPWRVQELELRFVDAQGRLVDVRRPELSDTFIVLPGGEGAFRARVGEVVFTNVGVIHQTRVQTATDGNLPLKPD